MRYQGMTVGWAVALVVGTAVITMGSVRAIDGSGEALGPGAQQTIDAGSRDGGRNAGSVKSADRPLNMIEMRNVLVSREDQPPTQVFRGPITLKQGMGEGLFDVPPWLAYDPAACGPYLSDVLGPLADLDGWVQFGSRVEQHHNNDFLQLVVAVPDGAGQRLINEIRGLLNGCASGTVTADGKVTGRVTTIEQGALKEPDAVSYAFTRKTSFDAKPGTQEYEIVAGKRLPPDNRPLVNAELYHLTQTNIVGVGRTLIVVAEANLLTSNEIARKMSRAARTTLVGR
ncbi:hypothetical protein [Allorhizocola rhizosphaerae]|uniref:hypothetical protein n=1 Tax=Allorhizocola rhizosphaerae TaxID=1872709 RepID=UPI0013C2AB22|nr:hypothetical protein [Allorhizocola rhizosphaerae]